MIFLDFIFEERDIKWLRWIERPLAKLGKVDMLSVCVALIVLLITAMTFATQRAPARRRSRGQGGDRAARRVSPV